MSAKGGDPRYPHRLTISLDALRLLEQERHAQAAIDRMQGEALRHHLADAGPGGRVVVQQFQDEVMMTVERKA